MLPLFLTKFNRKTVRLLRQNLASWLEQTTVILIVSANLILANPGSWLLLKSALLGEAVEPISSNPEHLNQSPTLPLTYNIKLIVVGDRAQLGDLDYLDSDIQTGFCLFSEIEQDIKIF